MTILRLLSIQECTICGATEKDSLEKQKKHCQCSYRVHGTRRKPKLNTCQRIQRSYPSFDAAHYFPWNDVFTLFTKQPNALRFIWVANPFFKLDRRCSASSEKETTVENYQNLKWREVARRRFKAHTPWLEAHSPGASQAAETGGRSRAGSVRCSARRWRQNTTRRGAK